MIELKKYPIYILFTTDIGSKYLLIDELFVHTNYGFEDYV